MTAKLLVLATAAVLLLLPYELHAQSALHDPPTPEDSVRGLSEMVQQSIMREAQDKSMIAHLLSKVDELQSQINDMKKKEAASAKP